jgi:O-antigen/teichoic acid export membrane protein
MTQVEPTGNLRRPGTASMLRGQWKRIRSSASARNAGWMFLGQGMSIACKALYFVFLARLLGSAQFGVYVGAVAVVSTFSQYSTFGSYSVFLRYVCPNRAYFAPYWGNVLVTTLLFGSILSAASAWAGPLVAHSFSWELVACVAVAECLCAQLTIAAGAAFQAFEKMYLTAALNLATNSLLATAAGVMLWHRHRASAQQWVLVALAISILTAFAALTLVAVSLGKASFSFRLWRRRWEEGMIFAFSYSTGAIYNNIDKAMLGHYGMNVANGIYGMAYRVIDTATMPFNSIQAALLPRFFREGVEGVSRTTHFAIRIVKYTLPIAFAATLVMLLSAPIIPHLLGPGFAETVSALRWLCLIPVFRSLHISPGDALTGSGHQKMRLATQTVVSIFNFGSNLYLIPHYSWRGAAWSSLATDGLLAALNWSALMVIRARSGSPQPLPATETTTDF